MKAINPEGMVIVLCCIACIISRDIATLARIAPLAVVYGLLELRKIGF